MSVDEYGRRKCRLCGQTCEFIQGNGGGLCCNCSIDNDPLCEECEERGTPS